MQDSSKCYSLLGSLPNFATVLVKTKYPLRFPTGLLAILRRFLPPGSVLSAYYTQFDFFQEDKKIGEIQLCEGGGVVDLPSEVADELVNIKLSAQDKSYVSSFERIYELPELAQPFNRMRSNSSMGQRPAMGFNRGGFNGGFGGGFHGGFNGGAGFNRFQQPRGGYQGGMGANRSPVGFNAPRPAFGRGGFAGRGGFGSAPRPSFNSSTPRQRLQL